MFPCTAHVLAGAVRCCFPSQSPISETFFCEIITRNITSHTPFHYYIQNEKEMLYRFISFQLGKRFLSVHGRTGHSLGSGQADSLDKWKGTGVKMVSKALLEKSSP